MANRQTSWARPQIHSKGIHTCIWQSINRYLCYLLTNVWLLLHAGNESSAQQKNKPNQVAELDTGQGTRGEQWDARCGMREGSQQWTRQISRVYLGRSVWPVSFQHLHMFPVTFDDYMIFLLFTRRVAFSFYLAWFVFCFGFCFCCCCHLRNVQRNGATADALHKNKSPTHSLTHTHTPSENRNNDVAHVPSCSRLEWLCPCHCLLSHSLSLCLCLWTV